MRLSSISAAQTPSSPHSLQVVEYDDVSRVILPCRSCNGHTFTSMPLRIASAVAALMCNCNSALSDLPNVSSSGEANGEANGGSTVDIKGEANGGSTVASSADDTVLEDVLFFGGMGCPTGSTSATTFVALPGGNEVVAAMGCGTSGGIDGGSGGGGDDAAF